MRVLAVVHGRLVGPELFADVICAAGHELLVWPIAGGGDPPAAVDAVLVLGGHMNVGEESSHPWLEREYELMRGWVAAGTPLLGICLGAQTLAHAFGARVAPAPERLAGFVELTLTAEGRRDALLGSLPERFEALFANAYTFDLPERALEIASREGRPYGFRLGERAWALQFHPEARLEQVLAWWQLDGDELPRPLEVLERELVSGIGAWQALGTSLCRAFLAVAEEACSGAAAAAGAEAPSAAPHSSGRAVRDHSCHEPA